MEIRFASPDADGARYASFTIRQVKRRLRGLGPAVGRVEVLLEDDDGPQEGRIDKRCRMRVELAGGEATSLDARARRWRDALDLAIARLRERVLRRIATPAAAPPTVPRRSRGRRRAFPRAALNGA